MSHKSKKKALSIIILFAFCSAIMAQASAQTPTITIGVSEGDTFKYTATYFWNSTNPNDTVPKYLLEQNTTEYLRATIKTVTGNTVTISEVQHFLNGTDVPREELTSVGTSNQFSVLLYAANLNAGDYLLPMSQLLYTIDATVSREYAGGARQTNYIEVNMTDLEEYVYRYTSLYFDRSTGILVDAYFADVMVDSPSQTFSYTYLLTETNRWNVAGSQPPGDGDGDNQIGGLPMELIIGIVVAAVVVAVVAVVLFLRKKGKN